MKTWCGVNICGFIDFHNKFLKSVKKNNIYIYIERERERERESRMIVLKCDFSRAYNVLC